MTRIFKVPVVLAAVTAVTQAIASPAALAERKSPLDGQPAVRHRLLLVRQRFELTPTFETSLNADYRHTIGGGLKGEYHLTDGLSIGAVGIYATSFNTGLTDRILETLPDTAPTGDPTPTALEYEEHLNKITVHGAAYATWTPWYGKLAAFGKAFVSFDFYFSGGAAFAQLSTDCCSFTVDDNPEGDPTAGDFPDQDPNNDAPLNDGTKLGLYLAGGIHVYLNQFIALDLAFRDYMFSDNPSGLDFDADRAVTDDDSRFLNHFFFGFGVSILLPTHAERTP